MSSSAQKLAQYAENLPAGELESHPPSTDLTQLRVALVSDFLESYSGAERCLDLMLQVVPHADVYATVDFLSNEDRRFLGDRAVRTSFLQRLPFKRKFRSYLALWPLAIEHLDLSGYDLVISSSHAVAKGAITGPDQLHLCYCHSPMRYAWDLQNQYLEEANLSKGIKGAITRAVLSYIRQWDARSAASVDEFAANSEYVARRIRKFYRRDSIVIYPPVDTESFQLCETKEDFYVTASRFVPYKKMSLIAKAFAAMPDKKLIMMGKGPRLEEVRALATPNVQVLGHQPFEVMRGYMQRAKAFVFAAEEDFGIVPLEAQACGTPVIAFGRGGSRETVVDGVTGILFEEQTVESLISAVRNFETRNNFDPKTIRAHAEKFSAGIYKEKMREFIVARCNQFRQQRGF